MDVPELLEQYKLTKGIEGKRIIVQGKPICSFHVYDEGLGNTGLHAAKHCRLGGARVICIIEQNEAIYDERGTILPIFLMKKVWSPKLCIPTFFKMEPSRITLTAALSS